MLMKDIRFGLGCLGILVAAAVGPRGILGTIGYCGSLQLFRDNITSLHNCAECWNCGTERNGLEGLIPSSMICDI